MSCDDPPAICPQLGAEAESSGSTRAWSSAAFIAAQASSSTVASQRLAAKESLRSFLKSFAEDEWLSLCNEALQWIRGQLYPSNGSSGLVAASCALIEENARRCSAGAQPPYDAPVPPEQVIDVCPAQPASANPLFSLCVARAVYPYPS
jgi:hypothetical protein